MQLAQLETKALKDRLSSSVPLHKPRNVQEAAKSNIVGFKINATKGKSQAKKKLHDSWFQLVREKKKRRKIPFNPGQKGKQSPQVRK